MKPDGGRYESAWTVRDEFAAKAMQGDIIKGTATGYALQVARDAYIFADAMLKEREKP